MATSQKFFLFLLRVSAGWMFFYAGITKVLNPQWSAEGYLKGAKSFVWSLSVAAPAGNFAHYQFHK